MKIYYFGTPKFAVTPLKALANSAGFKVQAVVTQPDKPGNRGKITPPPVKTAAEELNLPVLQPQKIDSALIEKIKEDSPDAIIVVAYGGLIPKELLGIPKHGCINIHPSLLPKYRGASPIQEALLNGDTETGVAIMKLDEELDHGGIYMIKRVPIEKSDTFETLSYKLAGISAVMLPFTLKDIENKTLSPIKQDDSRATFCRKIKKEDGEVDWNRPAQEILNQIKALNPWPSTYTEIKGKKLKILEAMSTPSETKSTPGTIEVLSKEVFGFHTKDNLLTPTLLQLEGKSEMTTKEFLNGYRSLL